MYRYIYVYMYPHTAICVSSYSGQAVVNIKSRSQTHEKQHVLYVCPHAAMHVSLMLRLHTKHTSAYVSIRQHTSVLMLQYMCPSCCDCIRQHTSAYVSIRQHTSVLMLLCTCPSYSGQVVVNISAGVKFTKSSMFQSKITHDTIKELGKTYTAWVQLAELVATGRCMRTHI